MKRELDDATKRVIGSGVLGAESLRAIAERVDVSTSTVSRYRDLICSNLEARGLELPKCGCGREATHTGQCAHRRDGGEPVASPHLEILDELLVDGSLSPSKKRRAQAAQDSERSSEEQFVYELGRAVGAGESWQSLCKRREINASDFVVLTNRHKEHYDQGRADGAVAVQRPKPVEVPPAEIKSKRQPPDAGANASPANPQAPDDMPAHAAAGEDMSEHAEAEPERSGSTEVDSDAPGAIEMDSDGSGEVEWDTILEDLRSRERALEAQLVEIRQGIDAVLWLRDQGYGSAA